MIKQITKLIALYKLGRLDKEVFICELQVIIDNELNGMVNKNEPTS